MHGRRNVPFVPWAAGLVLVGGIALVFFAWGCGGSGGGGTSAPLGTGGFGLSDLGGGWFGPSGSSTTAGLSVGTGTAGMTADPGGAITEFRLNGSPELGVTGTATLFDALRGIFTFTRTDGRFGVLMMAADKNHLLYLDDQFRIGAMQRGATSLNDPYVNADVFDTSWTGIASELDGALQPTGTVGFYGTIDLVGTLNASSSIGRTAMTDVVPITTIETANGQFGGDYIDNDLPPNTGNGLFLMTPDKIFMAGQFCNTGATFPTDCLFAIWSKL